MFTAGESDLEVQGGSALPGDGTDLFVSEDRVLATSQAGAEETLWLLEPGGGVWQPLWAAPYDILFLGVEDGYAYYREYDTAAAQNQVIRRALDPGAQRQVLLGPSPWIDRGIVHEGALFVVDGGDVLRIAVEPSAEGGGGAAEFLASLPLADGQYVSALTTDGDFVYLAVSSLSATTGTTATLWALDI
jgi:hypothetical protein